MSIGLSGMWNNLCLLFHLAYLSCRIVDNLPGTTTYRYKDGPKLYAPGFRLGEVGKGDVRFPSRIFHIALLAYPFPL